MPDESTIKPPIYLLDTMYFIFRAYHAMQRQRPMSTRTGVPTAATYVFVNMINKLRRDFKPEYFAAIFDLSTPVFRDERAKEITSLRKWNAKTKRYEDTDYLGYKATRTEMPADLAQQLPYIRRALEAFRIPMLEAEGYEADDVIGTISKQASNLGHNVFIVSADKDMMQLVENRVKILNPMKDNLILDRAKVEETLGVPPERVVDVMALRGDSIDNIPGAPGIGDKGSVELIQQFGSVEATLDRADEVKRKTYRESLQQNRETILLSKELVTIHCEVPMNLDLNVMKTQPADPTACRALFSELEFTSLLKELAPEPPAVETEFVLSPTKEQIEEFVRSARAKGFALSLPIHVLETLAEQSSEAEAEAAEEEAPAFKTMSLLDLAEAGDSISQNADFHFAVATEPERAFLISLAEHDTVRALLEDDTVTKTVHDVKGCLRILQRQNISLRGVKDDVMLLSYLINPTHTTHRLPDVVARFTSRPLQKTGDEGLLESAAAIAQLKPLLSSEAANLNTTDVYQTIDQPLAPVLLRMEEAGVRIDIPVLEQFASRLAVEMHRTSEQIYSLSGHRFNINSPRQLGDVLFNKMGLEKPLKYGKGKVISTAQDVLEELAEKSQVPRLVLEYRQLAKLKSNYADSLPLLAREGDRVHTTFNQVGTATGRLSSTNPNLQNIPIRTELGREIRAAFISAPGHVLLSADYSQIELRLMAHYSEDPLLVHAFANNEDIHTLTASEVFGVPAATMSKETRNRAKAVNFGIVYGISPFGLAQQLGIPQSEAKLYIETYFARYQGVKTYIEKLLDETRRNQSVRTLFGRVRPIPDIQSRNPNLRGFAERTAVNTPLQGTAADLIKLAMIRIDRRLKEENLKSQMILQVHDELLFDVQEDEVERLKHLVKHEMEHVIELKVPLVADCGIGKNWRDLKE
jgi:DNA polymerase I